jgi:hypothetical protein
MDLMEFYSTYYLPEEGENTYTRVVYADSIPMLRGELARCRYAVLFDCADYAANLAESRESHPANRHGYLYQVERVERAEVPVGGGQGRYASGYVIVIRNEAGQLVGHV